MGKQCSFKDCKEEVPVWAVYCSTHYDMLMQVEKTKQEQARVPPMAVTEPPKIPTSQFSTSSAPIAPMNLPNPPVELRKALVVDPSVDRVMLRSKCLEVAINLITGMEFENQTYAQLTEQAKTLTNEFEAIVLDFD